ncbi:hypothetical protein [Streptomyces sp. NPDC093514]
MSAGLRSGQVAEAAGVNVQTLRYGVACWQSRNAATAATACTARTR